MDAVGMVVNKLVADGPLLRSKDDDILRMALMEKVVSNTHDPEGDRKAIQKIRSRPNVVIAVGNRIPVNAFDRWLQERSKISGDKVNVYWIHTKYMLVDPIGETPIVITGSANFSAASIETNDEKGLVIRGDKRIADMYFGEFQRLYAHYAFREAVQRNVDDGGHAKDWQPSTSSRTPAGAIHTSTRTTPAVAARGASTSQGR